MAYMKDKPNVLRFAANILSQQCFDLDWEKIDAIIDLVLKSRYLNKKVISKSLVFTGDGCFVSPGDNKIQNKKALT